MILYFYFIINLIISINNVFFFIPYMEKTSYVKYNILDKIGIFFFSLLFGLPMETYFLISAAIGERNE